MKAYLIQYYNEEFENIFGIQQLKEFTQYRITVEKDEQEDNFKKFKKFKYKSFENLTEEECLNILETDGYNVQIFEIL